MIITHFSAGFIVMLLMLARLFLRTRHYSPAIAPPAARWQTGLAHLVHTLIYALFITLPILGVVICADATGGRSVFRCRWRASKF